MMPKWLPSLAAAISGKTDNRLDTARLVAMNEGHRDSGELIQEYFEFVTILEDTRTRVETVLSDPSFSANGPMAARLKRVAADLERAVQTYSDKSNASRS
jgi:hypothetical protein